MLERLLKRPIERVEGVSKVELQGVDPLEIRILIDADRLAAHGLAVSELKERLEQSNFAVSAGRITDGRQRFNVRPRGELTSLAATGAVALNGNGARVSD